MEGSWLMRDTGSGEVQRDFRGLYEFEGHLKVKWLGFVNTLIIRDK